MLDIRPSPRVGGLPLIHISRLESRIRLERMQVRGAGIPALRRRVIVTGRMIDTRSESRPRGGEGLGGPLPCGNARNHHFDAFSASQLPSRSPGEDRRVRRLGTPTSLWFDRRRAPLDPFQRQYFRCLPHGPTSHLRPTCPKISRSCLHTAGSRHERGSVSLRPDLQ